MTSIRSTTGYAVSVPTRFSTARAGLVALREAMVQSTRGQDSVSFTARYDTRVKYASQPIYGTEAVYSQRDIYEDRAVTEEQDVYETRPVYTDRDIHETHVTGTRNLRGFASASAAGLSNNADFGIAVGSHAEAAIKFSGSTISVTVGGVPSVFTYDASVAGAFQASLVQALNSVTGLHASLDGSGHLALTTDDAQAITLNEVPNGFLDLSGNALDKLGLTSGTTNASYMRTEREQTGTEQVKTGTQTVVVGTERVKTGTEMVETGTRSIVVGTDVYEDGTATVIVGYDRVTTPASQDLGLSMARASARQSVTKLLTEAQKALKAGGSPIGNHVTRGLVDISSALGKGDELTLNGLDAAIRNFDKARGAYLVATGTGATSSGTSLSILA